MQSPKVYKIQQPDQRITGLTYVKQFITREEEVQFIKNIVKSEWNTTLKRRTQHYGFQYRYDKKNEVTQTHPLPQWSYNVKKRIQQFITQHLSSNKQQVKFDQLIINEYIPGQGINPHTDNTVLFSSPIVSLSLGSECIMQFDHQKYPEETIQLRLNRRSIFILDQQARYEWKHSIPARKKDQGRLRSVRYSLTFRIMKSKEAKIDGEINVE